MNWGSSNGVKSLAVNRHASGLFAAGVAGIMSLSSSPGASLLNALPFHTRASPTRQLLRSTFWSLVWKVHERQASSVKRSFSKSSVSIRTCTCTLLQSSRWRRISGGHKMISVGLSTGLRLSDLVGNVSGAAQELFRPGVRRRVLPFATSRSIGGTTFWRGVLRTCLQR